MAMSDNINNDLTQSIPESDNVPQGSILEIRKSLKIFEMYRNIKKVGWDNIPNNVHEINVNMSCPQYPRIY